MDNQRVIANMN